MTKEMAIEQAQNMARSHGIKTVAFLDNETQEHECASLFAFTKIAHHQRDKVVAEVEADGTTVIS